MTSPRRPQASPLGAAIDVPHLAPHEALLVVHTLQRLAAAIWDAFGDDVELVEWSDVDQDDRNPDEDDIPW